VETGTSIYAFALNYSDSWSRDDVSKAHLEWGRLLREFLGPVERPRARDRTRDRRLKIGYLSAEFYSCVLMGCVEPILEAHSRDEVHITCYQINKREDETTERLRTLVDSWLNISGMNRQEAVNAIRGDECDILIDLDGHLGGGRLDIVALRPAPILVPPYHYAFFITNLSV
jgi:predicted O-linked N-acetylglucosamine transferase (SPINDLY family)